MIATPNRTDAIVAAVAATLEVHRAEIDAGCVFESVTLILRFHKSGALSRVIYRPESVKVL